MPEVDARLAAAVKAAISGKVEFALIIKGSEGKFLVGKKKPSSKEINDAKTELGGGTVIQGTCRGAKGTLVLQAAGAPGTAASVAKKAINKDAGLTVSVEFREPGKDDEETEGESEE